jgi:pimeloyl-ACP methyl ester carboxylesterase
LIAGPAVETLQAQQRDQLGQFLATVADASPVVIFAGIEQLADDLRSAYGRVEHQVRLGPRMPQVEVDGLTINYDVQGEGEPLLLIPYTSADHACYAFQLPAYTEYFSCVAIDLPGSGESDKAAGPYSTDGYAGQVAAFLGAIGIERAHVAGVSLGAAVGIHLAARHPDRVRSLSLHSGWHASDPYLKSVVEQWRTMASALPTVADVVIQGIFPWCFTPEMYIDRPEFVGTLADFVRSRPAQPVDAFLAQTDAVIGHDASAVLREIGTPTSCRMGTFTVSTVSQMSDLQHAEHVLRFSPDRRPVRQPAGAMTMHATSPPIDAWRTMS